MGRKEKFAICAILVIIFLILVAKGLGIQTVVAGVVIYKIYKYKKDQ